MRTVLIAAVVAVVFGEITTPGPNECLSDADCSSTECCYKQHEDLVVSKRQFTHDTPEELARKIGECRPYKLEGERCNIFGKLNGYCECNEQEGFTCQLTESDPTVPAQFEHHACMRQ